MITKELTPGFDFDNAIDFDLGFDDALEEAATKELGEEAAAVLIPYFERARDIGDFDRLARMTMELGAMACLHEHLQEVSNSITSSYLDNHLDHDDEEAGAKSNKHGDKKSKKKSKKLSLDKETASKRPAKRGWFELLWQNMYKESKQS